MVNSYHHQAIARLGRDVEAVACADDGIVEAIELPAYEFALGVQWELQESWRDGAPGLGVFAAFAAACRRHASQHPAHARPVAAA